MGSGQGSVCTDASKHTHYTKDICLFTCCSANQIHVKQQKRAVNANPWKDGKLTSNRTHWAIRMNYWCMLIFMQVIIGKVLIFSPNLQHKVPLSLFHARWLYINQKQTAKQPPVCIKLTVLAVSQQVHYGKTSSALSLSLSHLSSV